MTNSPSELWRTRAQVKSDELRRAKVELETAEARFTELAACAELDQSANPEEVALARTERDLARERISTLEMAIKIATQKSEEALEFERRTDNDEKWRQAEKVHGKRLKLEGKVSKLLQELRAALDEYQEASVQLERVSPRVSDRPDLLGQLRGAASAGRLGKIIMLEISNVFDSSRWGSGVDVQQLRDEAWQAERDLGACFGSQSFVAPDAPRYPDLVRPPGEAFSADYTPPARGRFTSGRIILGGGVAQGLDD